MKKEFAGPLQTAELKVNGATCPSCVFAIEHAGRKIPGIEDVRVDVPRQSIRIEYKGGPDCLEKLATIVSRLGYETEPVA